MGQQKCLTQQYVNKAAIQVLPTSTEQICSSESTMKQQQNRIENWTFPDVGTVIGSACVVDSLLEYKGSSNRIHQV